MAQDTIAAISTAPGEAALAVVRISGPAAASVLGSLFRPTRTVGDLQSHHLYLGTITNPSDGREVDQVMAVIMKAPQTYTREDMAEIYCHGGALVSRLILQACFQAGARPARNGEFTRRAFLSGRMDLTQAEAVIRLIHARSEEGLHGALDQLEGKLKEEVGGIRNGINDRLMEVEARIDFPDDTSPSADQGNASVLYSRLNDSVTNLLQRIKWGQVVKNGISVVIAGLPNAGKSTLLNALLNRERAIVTPMAGTTRDAVEEPVRINDLLFLVTDTAGLGGAGTEIERLMEAKTREYLDRADLVVAVIDGSENEARFSDLAPHLKDKRCIIAVNKSDLPQRIEKDDVVGCFPALDYISISACQGDGLDSLREAVYRHGKNAADTAVKKDALFVEEEQKNALERCLKIIGEARDAETEGRGDEIVADLLRQALLSIREFNGESISESILDRIFSRFCIGK